jgi:hypothetical protein
VGERWVYILYSMGCQDVECSPREYNVPATMDGDGALTRAKVDHPDTVAVEHN